jgi:hypothetical protein
MNGGDNKRLAVVGKGGSAPPLPQMSWKIQLVSWYLCLLHRYALSA